MAKSTSTRAPRAARRAVISLALLSIALLGAADVRAWKLESDVISVPAGAFSAVTFRQTYDTVPVVVLVPSDEDPHPSALRIRNVTVNGFEVVQVRPPVRSGIPAYGPAPNPATVHYVAVEPGRHPLPSGGYLEAGTTDTRTVQKQFGGPESWDTVTFTQALGGVATVVGQIQTMNNEPGHVPGSPSTPFMTTALVSPGSTSVRLAIELSEVTVPLPLGTTETVGWIAAPAGLLASFTDSGGTDIDFEAITSGDNVNHNCRSVSFANAYPNPTVVATKNRHDGGDGGWTRRCTVSASAASLRIDEDQALNSERAHTSEALGVMVFSEPFDAVLSDVATGGNASTDFQLEADAISLPAVSAGATAFHSVTFRQVYSAPPLVFVLPGHENTEPGALRIRNVTSTGFEIAQVEPPGEDGAQPDTTVHYVAVERGLHAFPDGTLLEAGVRSTAAVQHGSGVAGGTGWAAVNLVGAFGAPPALVAQIQTMVNETGAPPGSPSIPWLTAAVRGVSAGGFQVALERAEANDGSVAAAEEIAYLAIEAGATGTFTDALGNDIDYEAILTGATVRGYSDGCFSIGFAGSYTAPPLVAGGQTTRNGNNGGWIRRCSLDASQIGLTVDEDQDRDGERAHIGEAAGLAVFSRAFDVDFALKAYLRMDEDRWVSAPDEVQDLSGLGNHGTAFGGTVTGSATPAVPGTPGTCGYGTFDGSDDHVEVGHDASLDGNDALTYSAWIRPRQWGGVQQVMAKSVHGGGSGRAQIGIFSNNTQLVGRAETTTGGRIDVKATAPPEGSWSHVALVFDGTSLTLYVNGIAQDATTFSATTLKQNNDPLAIGKRVGTSQYFFDGSIDEVRVHRRALSAAALGAVMRLTHTCPIGGINHFEIDHDGTAINCEPEPVRISAHLTDDSVDAGYVGTVNLSTGTGNGDWSIDPPSANLVNSGGGAATYTFTATDAGTVELLLYNPKPETVDIGVTDGITSESPAEDPPLEFAASGFRFSSDAPGGDIPTQISSKRSDVAPNDSTVVIEAIRTSDSTGACEAALVGTVIVEMAFECRNPDTCLGPALEVDGQPIAGNDRGTVSSYTPVKLDFGPDTESKAEVPFEYADVGELRLHARYDLPGSGGGPDERLVGTSNAFVVRPYGFDVDFADDRHLNGTGASSYAAGAGGTRWIHAGATFTATVTAVGWEDASEDDGTGHPLPGAKLSDNPGAPSFGRESSAPSAAITHSLREPATGHAGNLTGDVNLSGFTGGVADASLAWDEVGIIDLEARSTDYLGGGEDVDGTVLRVGRFYPARLFTVVEIPPALDDGAGWGCGFTYMDQPFDYVADPRIRIEARNLGNVVTRNYDGAFWKLGAGPFFPTRAHRDNVGGAATFVVESGGSVVLDQDPGFDGVARLDLTGVTFRYDRPATPIVPFAADIQLEVPAVDFDDADRVCRHQTAASCNRTDSMSVASQGEALDFSSVGGASLRFGRLTITNASGSELVPLDLPLAVEYYNQVGTSFGFQLAADDGCTALPSTALDLAGEHDDPAPGVATIVLVPPATTTTATTTASPMAAGTGAVTLSAPGGGQTGFVDMTFDLSASGADLPWLRFDWDGDSANDDDPSGRGSFGIYRGSDRLIHVREPW